jgi:hypothetical protein
MLAISKKLFKLEKHKIDKFRKMNQKELGTRGKEIENETNEKASKKLAKKHYEPEKVDSAALMGCIPSRYVP